MKLILLSFLFLFSAFQGMAQFEFDGLFRKNFIDSNDFNSRGIYVTYSPLCIGGSINTDSERIFTNMSSRGAIHWITNEYQKFQCFASYGSAYRPNGYGLTTIEAGLMIGKLWKGKKRGFFELNFGLSYFSRKENGSYASDEGINEWERIHEVHTVGIPFEATANTSKLPIGIGIGIVGNLNVNQPYAGLLIRFRLGNPVLRKHRLLKRQVIVSNETQFSTETP